MELIKTLGIDWRLLLAQLVNFLIVLFVLKRYALGPLTELLDRRRLEIERAKADAVEAARLRALGEEERARLVAEARSEAGRLVNVSREEGEKLRTELLQKSKSEVEEIVEQGKMRLEAEKNAMLDAAKAHIADLVVLGVEKVLPRVLSDADKKKLVVEAGSALKKEIL